MVSRKRLRELVLSQVSFSFSRSGGKGGQNVNKVNTKVLALFPLAPLLEEFGEERTERVRRKLKNKINKEGMLLVQAEDERTQGRNREIAVKKLVALLQAALAEPIKRKKTVPKRRSVEDRLTGKKRQAKKKERRRIPAGDE